jgi:hypothetical protein
MSNPTPNDGGPAFPHLMGEVFTDPECQGMTLRDWFAGQALKSIMEVDLRQLAELNRHYNMIDNSSLRDTPVVPTADGIWTYDRVGNGGAFCESQFDWALAAYQIADAMIAARKVGAK